MEITELLKMHMIVVKIVLFVTKQTMLFIKIKLDGVSIYNSVQFNFKEYFLLAL